MEESSLLERIYRKEKELQLENELLKGVPIWRIVRFQTRLHYISTQTGYLASTGTREIVGPRRIKLFSGFWRYLFKSNLNIFFSFNRLVINDGKYMDKFLDPVIEQSFLKDDDYVIIDSRYYTGDYPRIHKEFTISNERRTVGMQLLQHFFMLTTPLIYKKKIVRLFKKVKEEFNLPENYLKLYYNSVAAFLTEYYYFLFWFKLLQPRRVLLVYRGAYFGPIIACKKLSIPVAEFQHGITLDRTVSFTGDYDFRIDPDFFFTFGPYWKSNCFGMTDDRTICIGWAYSQMMKKQQKICEKTKTTVLAISSPEISDALLEALSLLSQWCPQIHYHIRLHPSESYNEEQKMKLSNIPQAELADNTNDSAVVLPLYDFVIGENSSVLYEALSMGCNVGLLNICGLRPPIEKPGISGSFYVINSKADYEDYLAKKKEEKGFSDSFYSEFDKEKFRQFLNQYM